LSRYGEFQKLPKMPKKIIHGKKTEIGNIRNNYKFSYKILKYKCIKTEYCQEELRRTYNYIDDERHYSYNYVKLKNIMEYKYNLESLRVKNILESKKIQIIINDLKEIKLIEVNIDGNYLIISKETVLYSPTKDDYERNIADIELFYNKIVKNLLEVDRI